MAVNVPVTVYRPTDGNSEFSNTGVNNIVDTSGNQLVDTAGNNIVDTGVTEIRTPGTEWHEDDGI